MRSIQQRATEIADSVADIAGDGFKGTTGYVKIMREAEEHLRAVAEQGYAPDLDLVSDNVLGGQLLLRADVGIIILHRFPRDAAGNVCVENMPNGGAYAHYFRGHPATAIGLCGYAQAELNEVMRRSLKSTKEPS